MKKQVKITLSIWVIALGSSALLLINNRVIEYGKGGYAYIKGSGTAIAGKDGIGFRGGKGGNAIVEGSESIAIGGDGGNGVTYDKSGS